MSRTSAKENAGKIYAKQVHVLEPGGLTVNGATVGGGTTLLAVGGQVVVTGTLTFAVALNAIVSVVANLDQGPTAGMSFVTTSSNGASAVTLTVYSSADVLATNPIYVNWIAVGN